MAADERLLAPLRRFWTPVQITSAYQAIFTAYHSRLEKVTVIIQKTTEGDGASGQVVINREDYLQWMEACETRLKELENTAAGITGELTQTTHANFSARTLTT